MQNKPDKLRFINRQPVRRVNGKWECTCLGFRTLKNCTHIIRAQWDDFIEEEKGDT
jgi:hypothetical protein